MCVDFFSTTVCESGATCVLPTVHRRLCNEEIRDELFGLGDHPSGSELPAFIDTNFANAGTEWIATVNNPNGRTLKFKPIDNCVPLFRQPANEEQKRCDGMLHYPNKVIFVELKTGTNKGFIKSGREQLTETILAFRQHHTADNYDEEAYISNIQEPFFPQSISDHMQQFLDETGLLLEVNRVINIT